MDATASDFALNVLRRITVPADLIRAKLSEFSSHGLSYVFSHDMAVVVGQARHTMAVLYGSLQEKSFMCS